MAILKPHSVKHKTILVVLCFVLSGFQLISGTITRNAKITGSSITVGKVLPVQEDLYGWTTTTSPVLWDFTDKRTDNRIFLRYSAANKKHYTTAWSIDVSVQIQRYNKQGIALPLLSTVLSINYDPANPYTDVATYTATGGHRVRVIVTGITLSPSLGGIMPTDVSLENEIQIERYYDLISNTSYNLSHIVPTTSNKYAEIYWDFVPGAEEYDLEYFLLSDYAPALTSLSNAEFVNATRISTPNNWHRVNMAFDNGKLYYRVRAVGKGGTTLNNRLEADWIYCIAPVSSITNFFVNSNWTYSSTFAEDGKQKETATFFDGSQRDRQTVSLSNSENVTLISENFYDYEGRKVIQTLPAPNNAYDNDLIFYQNFSLNTLSTPSQYTKKDFDDGSCTYNYAMSAGSGASNYYSNTNNYLVSTSPKMFYPAIPDAFLYPMTRTTYNNENEVKSQSGVGVDHKIGSNHETIFLNATASQEKLDRLFGNEVGHAEHYKEEVVIDPNGQISVSYKNLSGQVIATAMRSNEPTNLLSLKDPVFATDEPYMTAENTKEDLIVLNKLNVPANEYVVSKDFLVTNAGTPMAPTPYNFVYDVSPQTFNDLCTNTQYPCKYILKISITDECGQPVNAITPMNTYLNVSHNIDPVLYPTGYSAAFTVNFPANGLYKIEKSLMLDPVAMAGYVAAYQALAASPTNTCIKTLSQLESEYGANVDLEECATCSDYCLKKADDDYNTAQGLPIGTYVNHSSPPSGWQTLYDQCIADNCNGEPVQKSCDGLLKKLKADVSPGGQYFEHTFAAGTTFGSLVLSTNFSFIDLLFTMNPNLPVNDFEFNFTQYLSANPSCSSISSGNFTQSYIKANWDPCWADFLVMYHPEYCRYQRCVSLAPSESFDYLLQTLNYTTAQNTDASGNVCTSLPACAVLDLTASGATGSSLVAKDPFFTTSIGSAYATSMSGEINNCTTCAALVGAAPVVLGTCSIPSPGSMWDYATCYPTPTSTNDQKWQNFITLYQYLKKKYQSNVGCPALVDGSLPPDLITSNYYSLNDVGAYTYATSVSFPIDNGMTINDPDFNVTINSFLSAYPPLSSSTSPPASGFGSQYGPNDCWYDASYVDLGSDYAGNSTCSQFMTTGVAFPGPANAGLQIQYAVSSVPGYPGTINISNNINLPNPPQSALTYLNLIANDINAYVSTPDFTAYVDLANPLAPKLIISAPVSLGPNTLSGPPIQLSITRTESSLGNDVCQYFNFNPSVQHCNQYVGPDCVCGVIQELIDMYNAIVSPTLTLQAFIRNNLNSTYTISITSPIVNTWMTNCSSYGSPLNLLANGDPDTSTPGFASLHEIHCDPPCNEQAESEADYAAEQEFESEVENSVQDFIKNYTEKCLSNLAEVFTVEYPEKEYHYTLYYYDQAGNLVRTVPPVAVQRIPAASLYTGTGGLNIINELRTLNTYSIYPGHTRIGQITGSPPASNAPNAFVTNYFYNSYNQLVNQVTPDGGETNFWYDDLGRLRFSQNAKQLATPCYACAYLPTDYGRYSYTIYDAQNRIIEVGENDEVYSVTTGTPPVMTLDPFYYAVNNVSFPSQNGLQVTKTYYDAAIPGNLVSTAFVGGQQQLRGRVSSTSYEDTEDANDNTYNHATHYSYDVHGNVNQLVQDDPSLALISERYKWMGYEYDLISGKVNVVHYQTGKKDQYHHRYFYDADNRITSAYTSGDHVHWERDARYFYYLHGPLARAEFGDEKIQGVDYAYTMQGWIKGVNGSVINEQKDFGLDGNLNTSLQYMNSQNNIHSNFARDVYGYDLDYFSTDYTAIGGSLVKTNLTGDLASSSAYNATPGLYNGNIRALTHAITDPVSNTPMKGLSRWFRYDQLNRIKEANNYTVSASASDLSTLASTTDYYENFRYDANGNILYAKRNGNTGSTYTNDMDAMTYNYIVGNNQLSDVTDVGDNANPIASAFGDIKNQTTGNYSYDAIGNLINDVQEQILDIDWSVYGKIRNIYRKKTSFKPDLEFRYDAAGNRICKIVKPRISTGGGFTGPDTEENWTYTYYTRDAQGNVMAVYDRDVNYISSVLTDELKVVENHLYGSSRMAIADRNVTMRKYQLTFVGYNTDGTIDRNTPVNILTTPTYLANYRTLGNKLLEFSNHLGNVINTVSDRKLSVDANSDNITDYYKTDTKSGVDYYAFGQEMPGRRFNAGSYRYQFGGKEDDQEIKGTGNSYDFGARMYDPRLGKFLSIDPATKSFPFYTPYQYASNSPVCAIDLDGLEGLVATGINGQGMVIRPEQAREIQKRVTVSAFKLGFSEELPKKFVEHYGYGEGKPVFLNESEMMQTHTQPVGLQSGLIGEQVNKQIQGMKPGETRDISFRAEDAQAGVSGTLGQFTIIGEGKFTMGENGDWDFSGGMRFYDEWDFNKETPAQEAERLQKTGVSRSSTGKEQTEFAHDYLPGEGFKIYSQKVPINQKSGEKSFDWFKGKSKEGVGNRDSKAKQETK